MTPAHCAECERLKRERDRLNQIHQMVALTANAAATGSDTANYIRLRSLADEALVDLGIATVELQQHQDRHAVPN